MSTGKRFRLDRTTMAWSIVGGERSAVTIPGGAIIKILSGPIDRSYNWNVKALWEGRTVEMFAADVDIHGTEIEEHEHHGLKAGGHFEIMENENSRPQDEPERVL